MAAKKTKSQKTSAGKMAAKKPKSQKTSAGKMAANVGSSTCPGANGSVAASNLCLKKLYICDYQLTRRYYSQWQRATCV